MKLGFQDMHSAEVAFLSISPEKVVPRCAWEEETFLFCFVCFYLIFGAHQ